MCGDTPLFNELCLWNRFKYCFVHLFMHSLINLFLYLSIVYNVCTEQEGIECVWSLRGCTKQFTRKLAKQTKNTNCTSLSPLSYWLPEDKNVTVFAVTLLFVLLMWDSFLSSCQSPTPPHFCTDDVKQSQQRTKANFVKILSVTLQNGYLNVYIFGD